MKKISSFVLTFIVFSLVGGWSLLNAAEGKLKGAKDNAKILVVYFSRVGEQYKIGNTKKGNTSIIAEFIAEYLGADIAELQPQLPYPKSYNDCSDRALEEQKEKARPALKPLAKNIKNYDIIFCTFQLSFCCI